MLGNLSPTATLKALEALNTNNSKNADILSRSVSATSTDERAYGIKAALAAQRLREWHTEVLGWKWPAKKDRRVGRGFQSRPAYSSQKQSSPSKPKHKEYLGSLPMTVVARHEERIDQIKDGLEALDVDGLKEHVLSAHIPSVSRGGTIHDVHNGVTPLSDFTAIIIHTMLQALPYLSKLTALLGDWDVRIVVLKQIPQLLHQLEKSETAIESAFDEVCARRTSGLLTRRRFEDTKAVLGKGVSLLGATFDSLLDLLEGREDSLPETWVHRMDKIEEKFAHWTVEAERRVLYNEWMEQNRRSMLERSKSTSGTTLPNGLGLRANVHVQGSYSLPEEMQNEHAGGLEPEKKLDGDFITTNRQPQVDDQNIASAVAPESQRPLVASAAPVASPASHEQGRRLPVIKPQPSLSLIAAPDLAIASQETREPQKRSSVITLEVQNASFSNQRTQPSTATATQIEGEAHRPEGFAGSTTDSVDTGSTPHAHFDDATSGYFPSATDRILREHHPDDCGVNFPTDEPVFEILNQQYSLPPGHKSASFTSGLEVKQPLTLDLSQITHRGEISENSVGDSAVSEAFSDLSNAEIVDATTAEALGNPKVVRHSFRASRFDRPGHSVAPIPRVQSMHLPRQDMRMNDPADKAYRKAASMSFDRIRSSFSLPMKTSDTVVDGEDDAESPKFMPSSFTPEPGPSPRTVVHRASVSSIEWITSNRVRNVVVHRRDSSSSSALSPVSPLEAGGPHARPGSAISVSPLEGRSSTSLSMQFSRRDSFEVAGRKDASTPVTNDGILYGPENHTDTPVFPRRSSRGLFHGQSADLVPSLPANTKDLATPTNSVQEPLDAHSTLQSRPSPVIGDEIKTFTKVSTANGRGREDLLESKIQNLLTRIPARIRLLSDSEIEDPPHLSSASSSRSQSPIPSIILSPAKQDRRPQTKNSSTQNSDVRLFHLTRSTENPNTPPTKLCVRLVGEHGERVMVRVGGGWADLGDYLREYSLHHSRRGLNNGQFELASLPVSGQKDSRVIQMGPELISKATIAGPSISKSRSPANSRPGSAMEQRPSAITPFGVLRPTRRRRSISATAMQESNVPNFSSPSPPHTLPSDTDDTNNFWETPPLPSIPQARTFNPYSGGDPRSSGPPRLQSEITSPHLPLTPTPATGPPQQSRHQPLTSLGGTGTKSKPSSSQRASGGVLVTTRTRSKPTTPAASRIAVDPRAGEEHEAGNGGGAPAPTIGSTYSSPGGLTAAGSVMSPKSSGKMGSLGHGGGIRRVFFRKKMAAT